MALRAIALVSLAGAVSVAAAQITAVPPAENLANTAIRSVAAEMLLQDGTPARTIELGALTPAETSKAATTSTVASRAHKPGVPLRIGIPRTVPASAASIRLVDLPWQPIAGGGTAARLVLTSDGAAALRFGIQLIDAPSGLVLRFHGSGAPAQTFGPVAASAMPTSYPYWSPVLSGERAVVEFALPAAVTPGNGHVAVADDLAPAGGPNVLEGRARSLRRDRHGGRMRNGRCLRQQSFGRAAQRPERRRKTRVHLPGLDVSLHRNARQRFHQFTTAYVFMANHCIDDLSALRRSARRFHAIGRGCEQHQQLLVLPGGDLRQPGDPELRVADRRCEPSRARASITTGASCNSKMPRRPARRFRLARGALDRRHGRGYAASSRGRLDKAQHRIDRGLHYLQRWQQLHRSAVDSGRHRTRQQRCRSVHAVARRHCLRIARRILRRRLVVFDPVRASTSTRASTTPSRCLAQYLTPNVTPADGASPVVEFYNATLDDYFMTIDPARDQRPRHRRASRLDSYRLPFSGLHQPDGAPAGASPVCRFYVLPAVGDSHFYSADPRNARRRKRSSSVNGSTKVPRCSTSCCRTRRRAHVPPIRARSIASSTMPTDSITATRRKWTSATPSSASTPGHRKVTAIHRTRS